MLLVGLVLLVGVVLLVSVVLEGVLRGLPWRWTGVLLVGVLMRLHHLRDCSHRDCHQERLPGEHAWRHDDLDLAAIRRVDQEGLPGAHARRYLNLYLRHVETATVFVALSSFFMAAFSS